MSKGPGRIERAIRELFDTHPDEAFVTDELAEQCYPDARPIERKHRVAVLRTARKVATADPDWAWYVSSSHGGSLTFFNQSSVPSLTMARIISGRWVAYRSEKRAERVFNARSSWTQVMDRDDALAAVQQSLVNERELSAREREVAHHVSMRDAADAEEVALLVAKRKAEQAIRLAELSQTVRIARNPMSVLLDGNASWSGNILELAEKARALMVQNDPDAVRAGLAEIADALEATAREIGNPLEAALNRLKAA